MEYVLRWRAKTTNVYFTVSSLITLFFQCRKQPWVVLSRVLTNAKKIQKKKILGSKPITNEIHGKTSLDSVVPGLCPRWYPLSLPGGFHPLPVSTDFPFVHLVFPGHMDFSCVWPHSLGGYLGVTYIRRTQIFFSLAFVESCCCFWIWLPLVSRSG